MAIIDLIPISQYGLCSDRELAKSVGLSHSTVGRARRALGTPTYHACKAFAGRSDLDLELLNVSLDTVCRNNPEISPKLLYERKLFIKTVKRVCSYYTPGWDDPLIVFSQFLKFNFKENSYAS